LFTFEFPKHAHAIYKHHVRINIESIRLSTYYTRRPAVWACVFTFIAG